MDKTHHPKRTETARFGTKKLNKISALNFETLKKFGDAMKVASVDVIDQRVILDML
ncbi:hypothetical protein PPNK14_36530 [Pectobacterium parmentieri]